MRSRAVIAGIFAVAFGLSACGKYGAPVRSVQPGQSAAGSEATETRPQDIRLEEPGIDETMSEPSDF
jgi:hypothetical protein